MNLIDVNPHQPREDFDEERHTELSRSIGAVGVLQPILVRASAGGRFELIAGERRLRAAKDAGLATIPVVLRDTPDDQRLLLAVVENLHRADLNPLELARAYAGLIDEHQLSHSDLAGLLGVDRTRVTRTVALLGLPAVVQRRVAAGVLSASHAELLVTLHDPGAIELLARRIVAEGLSVASVREILTVGGLPGMEELDGRMDAARARRKRTPRPVPEDLRRVADELGDRLDTRVRVLAGKSRGRIVVDFSDRADLNRILDALAGRPRE